MESRGRRATRVLVSRAVVQAGSQTALSEALASLYPVGRSTIGHWVHGRVDPPAWVLFEIAALYRLSLDEALLSAPEQRALRQLVTELRQEVQGLSEYLAVIHETVNHLLEMKGQPPMEFPNQHQG